MMKSRIVQIRSGFDGCILDDVDRIKSAAREEVNQTRNRCLNQVNTGRL